MEIEDSHFGTVVWGCHRLRNSSASGMLHPERSAGTMPSIFDTMGRGMESLARQIKDREPSLQRLYTVASSCCRAWATRLSNCARSKQSA